MRPGTPARGVGLDDEFGQSSRPCGGGRLRPRRQDLVGLELDCGRDPIAGLKYFSYSMLMRGKIWPSRRARYELALPRLAVRASTRRQRTTLASRITATARPMPNGLTVGSPLRSKRPNPNPMIIAAAGITRPPVSSPQTSERFESSPASACSLIWLTGDTSKSIEGPRPLAHAGRPSAAARVDHKPDVRHSAPPVIRTHTRQPETPRQRSRSVPRAFRVAPSVAFRAVAVPREGP